MRKTALYVLAGVLLFLGGSLNAYGAAPGTQETEEVRAAGIVQEEAPPVVVVLDPGHGGENLGAEYEKYTEKYMTMTVAKAMKAELEKYEGITVYLTREGDKDMTLEERVDFAKSVNADFLFCLHFNMSVKHDLFGAEVWVSAFDNEYQKGYTFASTEMDMLTELGLYSRGIKTKLNDKGTDYYGILRHATENDLPAALIEHCHLDQENDKEFYNSQEKLEKFGVLDATAVAKYYGLSSKVLGVDYSSYQNVEIPVPTSPVKPDDTEPDICIIDVKDVNEENGDVTVALSAQDYDSSMLYYSYSYDGGVTFSDLQKWEEGEDTIRFTMNVPSGTLPEIVVNAYNLFDKFTESNHIHLSSLIYGETDAQEAVEASNMGESSVVGEEENASVGTTQVQQDDDSKKKAQKEEKEITVIYFLQVILICIAILFVLFSFTMILISSRSKKKRRRRK